MRARAAAAVVGLLLLPGCLDIPAYPRDAPPATDAYVCSPGDADCDGWPAVSASGRVEANDCNDNDPLINPGAYDLPGNEIDEDCIDGASTVDRPGATGNAAGLATGDLVLAFDSPSLMPSSLTIGGLEALVFQSEATCSISNEEGVGISLYPAAAIHRRAEAPNGAIEMERTGPAMATAHVTWMARVASSSELGMPPENCEVETFITADIRFTVLPGGKLIRDDQLVVSASVDTCTGCPIGGGTTMPILSGYFALSPELRQWQPIENPIPDPQIIDLPNTPMVLAPDELPGGCLSTANVGFQVGVAWQQSPDARGVRIKSTLPTASTSLVFDWRRSQEVEQGEYRNITSLATSPGDGPAGCLEPVLDRLLELATPPTVIDVTYRRELGAWESTTSATLGNAHAQAIAEVSGGFALRAPGLGEHGITVWRRRSGEPDYVRLTGGDDYLFQRDLDGAYVIHVDLLEAAAELWVGGPGHEPPS